MIEGNTTEQDTTTKHGGDDEAAAVMTERAAPNPADMIGDVEMVYESIGDRWKLVITVPKGDMTTSVT